MFTVHEIKVSNESKKRVAKHIENMIDSAFYQNVDYIELAVMCDVEDNKFYVIDTCDIEKLEKSAGYLLYHVYTRYLVDGVPTQRKIIEEMFK